MSGNVAPVREVGGEFEWMGVPHGPALPWPQPGNWYALARDAVIAVFRQHLSQLPTLFVPDYFCPDVVTAWGAAGIPITYYSDDPCSAHPDLSAVRAQPGDMVLVVNYFGVRDGGFASQWHSEHPTTLLIEDHSHDPASEWALRSTADYAFASLRKTLPAPDGALLWSPAGHTLPAQPAPGGVVGSARKLAAMVLKKEYLVDAVARPHWKETFRDLQIEGEYELCRSGSGAVTPWSRLLLEAGSPIVWRTRREDNVRLFLHLISDLEDPRPVFTEWPKGHTPFNAVMLFSSEIARDSARAQLTASGIYPPVHWPEMDTSPRALDLASRILTIPLDQRYGRTDVEWVASVLRKIASSPKQGSNYIAPGMESDKH